MKRILLLLVAGGLVAMLSGCLPSTGGGGSSSGGGESLNSQVARHEQQIQGLLSQVGQVEQVLPGQAEMWAQMQTMRQDLNSVQGKLDGYDAGEMNTLREKVRRMETLLRQMASQMAMSTDSLDAPIADGGSGYTPAPQSSQPGYSVPPVAPQVQTPPPAGGSTDTADTLYNAGMKSFDQKKYQDAVVSFKDFVAAYPKHKLAGNAYFWQGESYFQMNDYARAALSYQEVIAKYPGSVKMQSAMLKQGIALSKAGKKDAATERLNELIKRYPSSPEATRAKQFLATGK